MNATMDKVICLRCPAEASPGRKSCARCRKYMHNHLNKRRAALTQKGLCLQYCGRPREAGATCCATCAHRKVVTQARDAQELKKRNICVDCGYRNPIPSRTMCEWCTIKEACIRAGGGRADVAHMADMLDEQKMKCYLCHRDVVLGKNAEIEHVYYPRSRRAEFGKLCDDPLFWRWACKSCNSSKGDKTLFEYQMWQVSQAFEDGAL